ncbi:unnamed protein product, partial [Heligmosomoides polygyrus]|uniref:TPX2_importin domain-containing protein n=1 Tax=Heligmosomoides polygyrus TaxID=6339 RepID=A0A183FAI9_HELPZ
APTSSLEDSDDEERLCVVEEGEIVEKEKAQDEQPQAHVDDDEEERLIVVESDEEDRLVLDDGQDSEEETSVVTRSKAGASVEAAVEKSKAEKPTKSKSGGTTAATTTLRTLPERSACVSTRRAHSTEDNAHVSTKASASRQTPRNVGALEAAKRSVSDFKAGPAAMEKFNATLSKQLRGRGRPPKNAPMPMRASSKGEEASRASASGETPPAPKVGLGMEFSEDYLVLGSTTCFPHCRLST